MTVWFVPRASNLALFCLNCGDSMTTRFAVDSKLGTTRGAMKKLLHGSLMAIGLVIPGATLAADMAVPLYKAAPPEAAAANWSGGYVGLNAGGAWNNDDGLPFCINPAGVLNGTGCETTNVPGAQVDAKGFIGGGQIGYNLQVTPRWLLLGVEADLQGSDIHGSLNIPGPFAAVGGGGAAGSNFTASEKIDWLGTVRARLGFAFDRFLIYGTTGLAYGRVDVSQNTIFTNTSYPSSASLERSGWTAGGGLEWAFMNSWSARLEYLFYDLGHIGTSGLGTPINDGYFGGKDFDVKGQIVRAAINYKFNWGAPINSRY
jgi:outer membrane immunogenic protein